MVFRCPSSRSDRTRTRRRPSTEHGCSTGRRFARTCQACWMLSSASRVRRRPSRMRHPPRGDTAGPPFSFLFLSAAVVLLRSLKFIAKCCRRGGRGVVLRSGMNARCIRVVFFREGRPQFVACEPYGCWGGCCGTFVATAAVVVLLFACYLRVVCKGALVVLPSVLGYRFIRAACCCLVQSY